LDRWRSETSENGTEPGITGTLEPVSGFIARPLRLGPEIDHRPFVLSERSLVHSTSSWRESTGAVASFN
jgi:hypothetical protein